MGEFYDRMDSNLRLSRRSEGTRREYLREAKAFIAHFMRPPTELGEAEIRQYLEHLVDVRHVGVSAQKMALASIKFLYQKTLDRPEEVRLIPWPKVESPLPEILTFGELSDLFDHAASPLYRASFLVAYGAGLRVGEVARLQTSDIDSQRNVIIVRAGKGKRDRLTMLSPRLLHLLRRYWASCKPPGPRLFPGRTTQGHISRSSLQTRFREAVRHAGIAKSVTFHSLRHAFATHLLEAGVDLRIIQSVLGHKSVRTTTRYTRVRADLIRDLPCPLDLLAQSLRSSAP